MNYRVKYQKQLNKGKKDMYMENQKILLKEINKDANKCKGILCSQARRCNAVNTKSDAQITVSNYNEAFIFLENKKFILKFTWN